MAAVNLATSPAGTRLRSWTLMPRWFRFLSALAK